MTNSVLGKSEGTVGPTGPSGASGSSGGYPFNSIDRMTTVIGTGNKSYMYVVLISAPTVISGFHTYTMSGSDNMRVGIYRGAIRSGMSGTIVLCGESASGPPSTIGAPAMAFTRRAITAVPSQNLSFASGELMTIAFHSAGITNVFACSPTLGAFQVDLAWNCSTPHAVANFPATFSSSNISSGNLQRLCFELY